MTASMGSSNHVLCSSRIQLNIHVARNSMWSLDLRSPRSGAKCRGGARQERLQSKTKHRDENAFTESQHSSLDLFYRATPLPSVCSSALMSPSGRIDWLGGIGRKSAFDIVREPIACLGQHRLYNCEVVFADFRREHFAGDAANNQFPVLVCGEASEWLRGWVDPIASGRFSLSPMRSNIVHR